MNDDKITNNADYVPEEELDALEDENGIALDPIEKNQDQEDMLSDEDSAKKALREGIEGNDDNRQDAGLDEEN